MNASKIDSKLYRETRWHLLKVGTNGSVRPLVHFKGWVVTLCGLMIVMMLTIAWFLFSWLSVKEDLDAVQKIVSRQAQVIESIRHEKDGVLARLVIAQSKLKLVAAGPTTQQQQASTDLNSVAPAPAKPETGPAEKQGVSPVIKPKAVAQTSDTTPATGGSNEVVIPDKVVADNLFICASPDDTSMMIEFKVINMGTRQQPVSGHVFIIIKDANHRQDQWLVLPSAMLMDGRPLQSRGQRFRIYNYRTIKFKVVHENPGMFTHATIFVFKNSGELIFERDFTLEPIKICH
jgi:hypothetical protein